MNALIAIIFMILSVNPTPKEERSILSCTNGGFYLNNTINIALCWGDDKVTVNYWMRQMGYIHTNQYPQSEDGLNFKGGKVLGYPINFIFNNFKEDSLVDINIGYYFSDDDLNYNNMNRLYNRLRTYFINNEYVVEKEIPSNRIFDREFSSCDGDCGMIPFKGILLDMELVAFLTGHAEQFVNFADSSANVELNIGVMKWTYVNAKIDSTYTIQTTYPVVGLNLSAPSFFKKHREDLNTRKRK